MDILRFSLGGKTAFFKKPDLNTYYSFTFGNIHKVALLGLLGAILGYKGYANSQNKTEDFPEFYEKLRNIQYSIVPKNESGFIKKKIQQFNNSVGYASKELGGNLIVKEQWLENPQWDIYIKLDSNITLKLADSILNRKCVYVPYLGKNDHPADIRNATLLKDCKVTNNYIKIDSLFLKDMVEYGDIEDFEEEYEDVKIFKYEESLPVGLSKDTQMYYYNTFVNTNHPITKYHGEVYEADGKNIVFN